MATWKEDVQTRRSLPSEEKEGCLSTRLAPPLTLAMAIGDGGNNSREKNRQRERERGFRAEKKKHKAKTFFLFLTNKCGPNVAHETNWFTIENGISTQ